MSALGEWGEIELEEESSVDVVAGADEAPELYFGSVDEFVREMIVPVFRRKVGERGDSARWSAEWWRSPETVTRLEALWRAWEYLRLEPSTGMSVWLRDHADYHLGVLFSPTRPFAESTEESAPGDPLPYTAPPEGFFLDVRLTSSRSSADISTAAARPDPGLGRREGCVERGVD